MITVKIITVGDLNRKSNKVKQIIKNFTVLQKLLGLMGLLKIKQNIGIMT